MPLDFTSTSGQPQGQGNGGLRLSRDRGVWLTGGLLLVIAAPPLGALAYLGAWGVMMAAMRSSSGRRRAEPGARIIGREQEPHRTDSDLRRAIAD